MTALLHGSILVVLGWLVIGGLGLPLPEDAALLATGALIYHHAVGPVVALIAVFAGVLAGDTMLFLLARRLGPAAYDRPLFHRLLPPARRARVEAAYRRHGGKLVFAARHLVGIRAAVFALAGIHGMRLRRFLGWDGLAACLSVPLVVGVGYAGALHLDRVRSEIATVERWIGVAAVAAIGVVAVVRHRSTTRAGEPRPPR